MNNDTRQLAVAQYIYIGHGSKKYISVLVVSLLHPNLLFCCL